MFCFAEMAFPRAIGLTFCDGAGNETLVLIRNNKFVEPRVQVGSARKNRWAVTLHKAFEELYLSTGFVCCIMPQHVLS